MIIHASTVHSRTDTRIRLKEVASLAKEWPGQVAIIVQDGGGTELCLNDGYAIYDIGRVSGSRIARMTIGSWRMFRAVIQKRPRVVHFHDPELLPWAALWRLFGLIVIYDVHENFPAAIMSKPYIHVWFRHLVSKVVCKMERMFSGYMSEVIVATPSICRRFAGVNPILIQNYPLVSEFRDIIPTKSCERPACFAYVGGVSEIRGAVEMIDAIALLGMDDVRLKLAGVISAKLGNRLRSMPGWSKVDADGWADRRTVAHILSQSRAGLACYLPEPNHVDAQPNKIFEYMAASLPVIVSDFPHWRYIVERAGCGILVNPTDPRTIVDAMQWILDHPDAADEMGRRGRHAVQEHYSWHSESEKLIAIYQILMK